MNLVLQSRRLAVLAGLCLLGACATPGKTPPPITDLSSRQCAAAPDLAKANALAWDAKKETTQDAEISEATPCMKGASGVALYVVYALPQTDAAYVIGVASPAQGSTLFAPHVMLLASDGSIKREYSGKQLEFHGDGLGVRVRNHSDEAYLVVASDPTVVGSATTRINEATQVSYGSTGYATYQVHTGSESQDTYNYAHNGKVVVTLTPIEPPK
jgi:hypothetical protein